MSMRKPYIKPQQADWWMKLPVYRRYMLREATSVLVLFYTIALVAGLQSLAAGEQDFSAWIGLQTGPLWILLNTSTFCALLLHALTWFELTPKMLTVRLGNFIPDARQLFIVQAGLALFFWLILVCLGIWWFGEGGL
jgi:fumarate reductase subunit C